MPKIWRTLIILGLTLTGAACTASKEPPALSEGEYRQQTRKLLSVVDKFLGDPDAERVHSVAKDLQKSRMIKCVDYQGICNVYGDLVTKITQATKDGQWSRADLARLKEERSQFRKSLREKARELHEDWKAFEAQSEAQK